MTIPLNVKIPVPVPFATNLDNIIWEQEYWISNNKKNCHEINSHF